MTTVQGGLREGSAAKRLAILSAARELFLADGFERASMDAVAARAGVSKRTVYDYYGDKRALFLAVVEETVRLLSSVIQEAIDEHLGEVEDVEQALVGLARAITATAIGSSDYAALMRLISTESANLPEPQVLSRFGPEPEDVLAERFAELDRLGLLDAPEPRLAADHLVALTFKPAIPGRGATSDDADPGIDRMIVEGVRAFLRAYGPGRNPGDHTPTLAAQDRGGAVDVPPQHRPPGRARRN